MEHNELAYDDAFWEATLGHKYTKRDGKHLLFSLLCYLNISLFDFLQWTFSSEITAIRTRAGRFLGYHKTAKDEEHRFLPTVIFKLWHEKFGKEVSKNLDRMLEPYARQIVAGFVRGPRNTRDVDRALPDARPVHLGITAYFRCLPKPLSKEKGSQNKASTG